MWQRKAERAILGTSRTGEQNATIYEEQIGQGRDPLFLDDGERSKAVGSIEVALGKDLEGNGTTAGTVRALAVIGRLFVGWIKAHIQAGMSEQGAMKPVTERTAEYKQKVYGSSIVMQRTGQLVRSLFSKLKNG